MRELICFPRPGGYWAAPFADRDVAGLRQPCVGSQRRKGTGLSWARYQRLEILEQAAERQGADPLGQGERVVAGEGSASARARLALLSCRAPRIATAGYRASNPASAMSSLAGSTLARAYLEKSATGAGFSRYQGKTPLPGRRLLVRVRAPAGAALSSWPPEACL